jgi:adenylate kinase
VLTRLKVYQKQTAPLLEYYRSRGLLHTVPGEGAIEAIRSAIRRAAGA